MQKTFQVKWLPIYPFWRILGVLNTLKVFCMKVSAMETDGAFTFPSVWVSGAAHLEIFGMPPEVFLNVLAESHRPRLLIISQKC